MPLSLVSEGQRESLIDLLLEINRHYHPDSRASRDMVREHAGGNLLAPTSPHRLVVASRDDGTVIGLAAITLVYSLVEPEPDRRRHCHLKELFVSAAERRRGVGGALMAWVADYAIHNGCHRLDWPVRADNARGIAFYEALGARHVQERLSYRLAEPELGRLARRAPPSGQISGMPARFVPEPDIRIRPAGIGDDAAIWRVIGPTIRAGETYALDRAMTERQALAYWRSDDRETFVAEDEGGIVGTYYLRANQAGGGKHVSNCGYMTSPAATGRGVARAMCVHSIARARERGYRAMQFNFVVSSNRRAVALWQSLGFEIVGRLPQAFEHPSLGLVDALVMYRRL